MDEKRQRTLQMQIDEQRQAADWREAFSGKQQDKARFFITLVTSETFAIGLSLNTMPPQEWLWAPCAGTFLACFAACFWCLYHFVRVLVPKEFAARNEGEGGTAARTPARDTDDEHAMLEHAKQNAKYQNEQFDRIVDDQGMHLQRGVSSFFVFNVIFAVALIVSRLAWFFPANH